MSLLLNQERSAYRKWVNVMASALLPGSAHFLSGRKRLGGIWFLASFVVGIIAIVLYASPFVVLIVPAVAVFLLRIILWVTVIIDGCRKPIPRLNVMMWAGVCVFTLAVAVLPFLAVRWFLFRPFFIPTSGMAPTLMGTRKAPDGTTTDGDKIIVNKWRYLFHSPERGDVVVFETEAIAASERERFRIPAGEIYVKRLVGLPGERVSIQSPDVYINGQKLLKPKIFELISSGANGFPGFTSGGAFETNGIQLGPDEYFVLGDNITNSLDSRYYGPIKSGYFIGKVGWIYWPAERRGLVE